MIVRAQMLNGTMQSIDQNAKVLAGMIGIGCLAPLVLFVVGAIVGHAAVGPSGVVWGAGIGFVSGLALLGLLGWILGSTKRR
jgi:hypothetical protein